MADARTLTIVEAVGARVPQVGGSPQSLVQLPPAVLQPARLDFDFVSAVNDSIPFGPVHPDANPVCGWVLPNHLDASLMAYDAAGVALGEMAIGMPVSGPATICWTNAPDSGYSSLQEIADKIPHFGPFLLTLSKQTPQTFTDVLHAIDETLWSTVPDGRRVRQGTRRADGASARDGARARRVRGGRNAPTRIRAGSTRSRPRRRPSPVMSSRSS